MNHPEYRVMFENEYYIVSTGMSILQYEGDPSPTYQLVNKVSGMVEYEEHLLPQIIGVAIQAAKGLVDFMETKTSPELTILQ